MARRKRSQLVRAMMDDLNFASVARALRCIPTFDAERIRRPGVIALLLPKTGSRHFSMMLRTEYGNHTKRGCSLVELHRRPVIRVSTECSGHLRRMRKHHVRNSRLQPNTFVIPADASGEELRERWREMQLLAIQAGYKFLSITRDPVDFVLSYFSYVHHEWTNETWRPLLQTILDDPFLHNYQLALLSGARFFDPLEEHERVEQNISFYMRACWGREPVQPVGEEDLQRVMRLVRQGAMLLGAVERFEDTVHHFARELQWRRFKPETYASFDPRGADRHRVDKKRRDGDRSRNRLPKEYLSAGDIQQIRERWSLDVRLHEFAGSKVPDLHYTPTPGGKLQHGDLAEINLFDEL